MFVTDTHPLIWYSTNHHSLLSPKVLRVFKEAEENRSVIYIPSVVLWETGLLLKKGSIKLPKGFSHWAGSLVKKPCFITVEYDLSIISSAIGYSFNSDPFDNLIVSTAAEMDLPFITKDAAIMESKLVEVFW